MNIAVKFINTEESPCPYYKDGRISSMAYFAAGDINSHCFEKSISEKYRKTRFYLMQKGLLGDVFMAAATDCPSCTACVPLRINTAQFEQTKRQKNTLENFYTKKGEMFWTKPIQAPALYNLYKKYINQRFPNSPMKDDTQESILGSIMSKTDLLLLTNTSSNLLGYAQVDRWKNEASLDYIVYDPDHSDLFLGNISFLETVRWAQENSISYIYIGTTNETKALKYKRYYSGLETFNGENWVPYDPKIHFHGPDYDKIIQNLDV